MCEDTKRDFTVMTIGEVMARARLGKSTIFEWVKSGEFPPPFSYGRGRSRTNLWLSTTIDDWILEKAGAKRP